jgi:hypothetical protein
MARYLCVHPGHEDDSIMNPVDVTAQVRLERALFPRTSAYLALTDDVVGAVAALTTRDPVERTREVYRILTGDSKPPNGEVILVPRGRVEREAGLYEIDDLRDAEPAVDRLIRRFEESTDPAAGPDEVVVIRDDQTSDPYGLSARGSSTTGVMHETEVYRQPQTYTEYGPSSQTVRPTQTAPEGVFSVYELGQRLADAEPSADALLDAIRNTGLYRGPRPDPSAEDWRVLIECPVPVGDPPTRHKVIFTGRGDVEPTTVYGLPLAGRELLLEEAANTELAPASAIRRADWRLRAILGGELAVVLVLGIAGWLSGATGFVVREAPWALALAGVLAITSVAVAVLTLTDPPVIAGNGNDLFTIRHALNDRIEHLATTSWVSTTLFALALFFAAVAPVWAAGRGAPSLPSPAVVFDASRSPIVATIRFTAGDVASGDTMWVDMMSFDSATGTGTPIGNLSATGDAEGRIEIDAPVSVSSAARYMAVRIWMDDDERPTCTPQTNGGPGCTVVPIPRNGPAQVAITSPSASASPSVPPTASASPATTGSASATPSAVTSPSPSISVTPSPVPTTLP